MIIDTDAATDTFVTTLELVISNSYVSKTVPSPIEIEFFACHSTATIDTQEALIASTTFEHLVDYTGATADIVTNWPEFVFSDSRCVTTNYSVTCTGPDNLGYTMSDDGTETGASSSLCREAFSLDADASVRSFTLLASQLDNSHEGEYTITVRGWNTYSPSNIGTLVYQ